MTRNVNIGWTDDTWGPVHGCHKVGPGCVNCYAARGSQRWGHTDKPWTAPNAPQNVMVQGHKLKEPHSISKPTRFFVNSASDVFHQEIPRWYRRRMFVEMARVDRHVFQILTKHGGDPEWSRDLMAEWDLWPSNVWMGVSVPNARAKRRIDALRETDAAVRFLSCEPLIGPLGDLDLTGIDWVIVGGESVEADNRRPMSHAWARDIREQCEAAGVPFFFKQSSARFPERGRFLMERGGEYTEPQRGGEFDPMFPHTRYRELPELPDQILDARPDLADWTPGGDKYGGLTFLPMTASPRASPRPSREGIRGQNHE